MIHERAEASVPSFKRLPHRFWPGQRRWAIARAFPPDQEFTVDSLAPNGRGQIRERVCEGEKPKIR